MLIFINLVTYLFILTGQIYLSNLNSIDDLGLQDELKESVKSLLSEKYKNFLVQEQEKNSSYKVLIHEEEYKNYISIL